MPSLLALLWVFPMTGPGMWHVGRHWLGLCPHCTHTTKGRSSERLALKDINEHIRTKHPDMIEDPS